MDRGPPAFGEPPVDAAHCLVDFAFQLLVVRDALPARDQHLREAQPLAVSRMRLEEPLDGVQALVDPLGVVEPVDADDFGHGAVRGPPRGGGREPLHGRHVDADGMGLDRHLTSVELDNPRVAIHLAAEQPFGAQQKVVDIGADVERHQVRGQQPAQQLPAPREDPEHVRRGEGDVQEKADARRGGQAAQMVRHAQQLIVVHPDEVGSAGVGGRRLGEALVHPVVRAPRRRIDLRPADEIVEQRPQRAVAEPLVILRHLTRRQRHGTVAHPRGAVRQRRRRRRAVFGGHAGPADPRAAAPGEHRLERANQPSRGTGEAGTIRGGLGDEGEAVADDDETMWGGAGGGGRRTVNERGVTVRHTVYSYLIVPC